MKILLVEDQPDKREQIKDFIINEISSSYEIVDKESLRGALKEICNNNKYDLILLDMSMPNFDPKHGNNADCSPESFAGRELLEQLELRSINIPVIVITQYSSFEGGTISLEDLTCDLKCKYGNNFLGSIYFNSTTDVWKDNFLKIFGEFYDI